MLSEMVLRYVSRCFRSSQNIFWTGALGAVVYEHEEIHGDYEIHGDCLRILTVVLPTVVGVG